MFQTNCLVVDLKVFVFSIIKLAIPESNHSCFWMLFIFMPFVDLFVSNIWIYLKIAIYVSIKTQLTETMTYYSCNCNVQNFLYINNLKLSVSLNIIVSYCLLYETCFCNIRLPQLISIKEVTERRTIVHFKITFLLQLLSELLFSLYVGFGWQTNISERKVMMITLQQNPLIRIHLSQSALFYEYKTDCSS